MKRIGFIAVLLALSLGRAPFALGAPDFSGTWVMDTTKSGIGTARGAATVTLVIKQTRTELTIDRKVGNQVGTAVHKLDGTESINKTPSGKDIKSTAAWAGSTLVIKSFMDGQKEPSTFVYSLSANGKVMTIETTMHMPSGEKKQKLIYNKQ